MWAKIYKCEDMEVKKIKIVMKLFGLSQILQNLLFLSYKKV